MTVGMCRECSFGGSGGENGIDCSVRVRVRENAETERLRRCLCGVSRRRSLLPQALRAVSSNSSNPPPIRPSRQAPSGKALALKRRAKATPPIRAHSAAGVSVRIHPGNLIPSHVYRLLPSHHSAPSSMLHAAPMCVSQATSYQISIPAALFIIDHLPCLSSIITISPFPFYHSNLQCHAISPPPLGMVRPIFCPQLAEQVRYRPPFSFKPQTHHPEPAVRTAAPATGDEHSTCTALRNLPVP